jgi:hypothetical protein
MAMDRHVTGAQDGRWRCFGEAERRQIREGEGACFELVWERLIEFRSKTAQVVVRALLPSILPMRDERYYFELPVDEIYSGRLLGYDIAGIYRTVIAITTRYKQIVSALAD